MRPFACAPRAGGGLFLYRLRAALRKLRNGLLLGFLLALFGAPLGAAEIAIRNAQLGATEDGYSLNAEFGMVLNGRLEDAVNKGVVLHFVIDFELLRNRWYWFDEQVVRRHKPVQLAYLALTRQYRVSVGNLHQTYASLGEAMRGMARLAPWPVLDKAMVKPDVAYQAELQMRLDLSQMPKTFQVSALSNKEWTLSSGWQRWTFVPRDAPTLPVSEPIVVPAVSLPPESPLPVPMPLPTAPQPALPSLSPSAPSPALPSSGEVR